jgi:hypothetical protein
VAVDEAIDTGIVVAEATCTVPVGVTITDFETGKADSCDVDDRIGVKRTFRRGYLVIVTNDLACATGGLKTET